MLLIFNSLSMSSKDQVHIPPSMENRKFLRFPEHTLKKKIEGVKIFTFQRTACYGNISLYCCGTTDSKEGPCEVREKLGVSVTTCLVKASKPLTEEKRFSPSPLSDWWKETNACLDQTQVQPGSAETKTLYKPYVLVIRSIALLKTYPNWQAFFKQVDAWTRDLSNKLDLTSLEISL